MTKENAKDYLPLVQALAEGKTIQEVYPNGCWFDLANPKFDRPPECYRVKPEPREIWINEYQKCREFPIGLADRLHQTRSQAEKCAGSDCLGQRRFVEVVE